MADAPASYLDIYLGPLLAHMRRPDVTDLYVNRPGEIWVERLGGAIERHDAPEVTEAQLWRLARQVASVTHQGISREHPLLAARLPDGARVQVVAPPATRGPMAVAIRRHVSADMGLSDYEVQGAFAATRGNDAHDAAEAELARLYEADAWSGFLRTAVRARKTIIVSGGTSTGKTTFLNALLREIGPDERLLLIEDTPELVLRHDNAVGLVAVRGALGEASVTTDDLLVASLRMRPDRIILGELRGGEAFTFLRAINTGHPGSLTTIHADTPARAVEQLALLVLQSGSRLGREDVVAYIGQVVDIIVQLERHAGGRRVSQVSWTRRAAVD
ncbi:P-type DNA transfer ATPase VirB11 [Sphingomonas lenta]|uniref:Type IV secretion system protein n=1 Tax=Sphingomonas lenta TaxID=1141887 RepID=A0A2A2SAX0_9SPHN|nr:P-type DNA transfer ATPase VirB11 [Sphingomonas lenta]PAX06398.1 P-type DNA transfer ATPase VirB11 [Sphingomonas lenta]